MKKKKKRLSSRLILFRNFNSIFPVTNFGITSFVSIVKERKDGWMEGRKEGMKVERKEGRKEGRKERRMERR